MIYALVGNQNCGKTTIFNEITNMNQHIGNFPGVTVDIKVGKINDNYEIVDLPGLYSLNTYTKEEKISKEFILNHKPNVIINVVDATNIERNLYLTLQLKSLGVPIVIALNFLDELESNKGKIDILELEKRIGLPIVPLTTVTKKEVNEILVKANQISNNYTSIIKEYDDVTEKNITKKYSDIEKICYGIVFIPQQNKIKKKNYKIDKLLTNKILGIPIFIAIMYIIFYLTFNVLGEYFSDLINLGIATVKDLVENFLISHHTNKIIQTLIIEGIFNGIGAVLSFLPIIIILYFFLSLLEDSGYMTRIAFILDKPLSKIGLSGRSAVAILLGFGCSVPAILSTRTIQSERERKLTMMLVPFMSCSAKIPIYAIFISLFFEKYASFAMLLIYTIGAIIGIIITAILNKIIKKEQNATFIMELPNYRFPTFKNTWLLMWNKTKEFIEKAFSIIFISSMAIWFLKSFDTNLLLVSEEKSMLAQIGQKISPIFKPLGFSDWRIVTSIITGISAKETVISTLSILTKTSIETLPYILSRIFTIQSSISFITFILLYTPCIAAISTIKKEFNLKTAIMISVNQCLIAYFISFAIYRLSNLLFYFF